MADVGTGQMMQPCTTLLSHTQVEMHMAVLASTDPGADEFVRECIQSLFSGNAPAYQFASGSQTDQFQFIAALLGSSSALFQMCIDQNSDWRSFDPDKPATNQRVIQSQSYKLVMDAIKKTDGLEKGESKKGMTNGKKKAVVKGADEDKPVVDGLVKSFKQYQARLSTLSPLPPPPFSFFLISPSRPVLFVAVGVLRHGAESRIGAVHLAGRAPGTRRPRTKG